MALDKKEKYLIQDGTGYICAHTALMAERPDMRPYIHPLDAADLRAAARAAIVPPDPASERVRMLKETIAALDTVKRPESEFTAGGKPRVEVLSSLIGWNEYEFATAAERDLAWAMFEAEKAAEKAAVAADAATETETAE